MNTNSDCDAVTSKILDWAHHSDPLANAKYTIALTGSRSYGFYTDSSDFDFEVICDSSTFDSICRKYEKNLGSRGITIRKEDHQLNTQWEIDLTIHKRDYISGAINRWKDEALWIWQHAIKIIDTDGWLLALQSTIGRYPKDVLRQKLEQHFLRDFHLSVHGLTYHPESGNLFSIVHTLGSKVAEYCRMCCLLDGTPFPYEKWLLRACQETELGRSVAPLLIEVIGIISQLPNSIEENWKRIQEAVHLIDTQACDLLEDQLVEWGMERSWIDSAYDLIEDTIYL